MINAITDTLAQDITTTLDGIDYIFQAQNATVYRQCEGITVERIGTVTVDSASGEYLDVIDMSGNAVASQHVNAIDQYADANDLLRWCVYQLIEGDAV